MAPNVETSSRDNTSPLTLCGECEQEHDHSVEIGDPTAYLLRSEANRKRLLQAIENINAGRVLIEFSLASNHVIE